MGGIHDARGRLGVGQRLQARRPPAGLLLHFTGCSIGRGLSLVDPAHRHLPAPQTGDEPVPPDQQGAPLIVNDDDASRRCHPEQAMFQVPPIRQLDISQAQIEPLVGVQRTLRAHCPLHFPSFPDRSGGVSKIPDLLA
jgi:hypothetical protein